MKKIVFMGTSEFAVYSLSKLFLNNYKIELVITQSDKPFGPKKEIKESIVKVFAKNHNMNIFQPEVLKTSECYEKIKNLNPDFIIVASYGKILPQNILDIPNIASINVHASLLPKWRGAAPIQFSIMNEEITTGVTIMLMDAGVDTGDILAQKEINIFEDETTGELMTRLGKLGSELLIETLEKINKKEDIENLRKKQNNSLASFTCMLKKDNAIINWNFSANKINSIIRSMNPWPISYTLLDNKKMKIYKSKILKNFNKNNEKPGKILSKNPFIIACLGVDSLELLEVQLESKKKLLSYEFVKGYKFLSEELKNG